MAKTKISKKQRNSVTKSLMVHEPFTSDELKDAQLVIETLLECIKTGDIDSFRDVLTAHLLTVNKVHFAKKSGLGRRTLYDLINPERKFNPELTTVSALIKAIAA